MTTSNSPDWHENFNQSHITNVLRVKIWVMKKGLLLLVALSAAVACNNAGKNSEEKADSINNAKRDTAIKNNNMIVVDEASSSFLVKAATAGMAEVQLSEVAKQNASSDRVKAFGEMMVRDHTEANETVKSLAAQKNVTLPVSVKDEDQKT